MKNFKNLRQKVEAKDGDGANIVKDREFKGKPSKTIPHAKPGEPGYNTHDSMFKKDGSKPAWMARKEKMKKEAVELDEDITKMSHGRLKFHMNNKHVPHGSYSWDQMKAERDRRLKTGQANDYKAAKSSMSEEAVEEKKLTPAELKKREEIAKAMERENPGMDMKKKMAIATAAAKKVAEAKVDEISLSHLSNTIAKSTGTKNIKTAMKPGEVKKGLDDLRKRLGTLGKEPKMAKEAYEDDEPASPDEAGMAMSQLKFICYAANEMMENIQEGAPFPEWFQNKLTSNYESMKDLYAFMEGENEMDEAVVSADKKPEKFTKPDGTVGVRMVRMDKKIVDKDA